MAWLNQEMNSSVVKTVLSYGYSKALVSAVLDLRYASHGSGFCTPKLLTLAILDALQNGDVDVDAVDVSADHDAITEPTAGQDTHRRGAERQEVADVVQDDETSNSSDVEGYLDVKSLKEEIRPLKHERVCKCCLGNEMNIAFLPGTAYLFFPEQNI